MGERDGDERSVWKRNGKQPVYMAHEGSVRHFVHSSRKEQKKIGLYT